MSENQYVIDRSAVEAEVLRTRATLTKGRGRYFVRQFIACALTLYVIMVVAQPGNYARLAELTAVRLWTVIGFPALAALLVAWWTTRQTFRAEHLDPELRIQQVSTDLKMFGGPGWVLRSLLMGIKLGLVIGVTVGLMMLLTWDSTRVGATSRWTFVGSFIGATLLWTVPAAFVIRWLLLLSLKKLVKVAPPRA